MIDNLSAIIEIYIEILTKNKPVYSYKFSDDNWKVDIGKGYFIGQSYS